MWPAVLADPTVAAGAGRRGRDQAADDAAVGHPGSGTGRRMRDHDDALTGLEITTCLSDGELEIVTRYAPDAAGRLRAVSCRRGRGFSDNGILDRRGDRGRVGGRAAGRLGAEHRDGRIVHRGLLAARLTERAGIIALCAGQHRRLRQPGQARAARRRRRSARAVRCGQRRGGRSDGARCPRPVRFRIGRGDHRRRRTGRRQPQTSRSGWCTSASPTAGVTKHRKVTLPGDRADIRRRTVQVALHLVLDTLQSLTSSASPAGQVDGRNETRLPERTPHHDRTSPPDIACCRTSTAWPSWCCGATPSTGPSSVLRHEQNLGQDGIVVAAAGLTNLLGLGAVDPGRHHAADLRQPDLGCGRRPDRCCSPSPSDRCC